MAKDDEHPDELYDFLYRDTSRLDSYYAQIFQGKLASIDELEGTADSTKNKYKSNIGIAAVEHETTGDDTFQSVRKLDPHDMNAADVLAHLQESNFINSDINDAANGEMVLVRGKLRFTDRHMLSASLDAFNQLLAANPGLLDDENAVIGLGVFARLLADGFLPPILYLQTDQNLLITGTVKESGLEEPVTTYYLRHGNRGLEDTYIIGIKEDSHFTGNEHLPALIGGTQDLANALSALMRTENSVTVTPLVIFRVIHRREDVQTAVPAG